MIPGWLLVVVLLVALAVIVGMWLSGMASRLNRLHIRTDSARLNLEGALQGRAAVIGIFSRTPPGPAVWPCVPRRWGHGRTRRIRCCAR